MNKAQQAAFDKDPVAFAESLIAKNAEDKKAHEEALKAKDEAHAAELKAIQGDAKKALKIVPGTFKSKGGKTYKFKDGHVKTRNADNIIVDSESLLTDREFMQRLVDIESGVIEEVKSGK